MDRHSLCPRLALAAALAILAPGLGAQTTAGIGTTIVFPLASQTTSFTSEVTLFNPGASAMTASVTFHEANNSATPGLATPCNDVNVAAGRSAQIRLSTQCTLTATSHFGLLIIADKASPQSHNFYGFIRAQNPQGIGFSVEGFPVEDFSNQVGNAIGLTRQAAPPGYQTNCFVGSLDQPVSYSLKLFNGFSGSQIGNTLTGSLAAFKQFRYLDVFGVNGVNAPAGDQFNVRAEFTQTSGGSANLIGFCTVQENTTFGADFRVAKSYGSPSANFFAQGGNAFGTTATLGTTDNNALNIIVHGARVMRYELTTNPPNIIGGSVLNGVVPGITGATIGGGGTADSTLACPSPFACANVVTDNFGTVGGGAGNLVGSIDASSTDDDFGTVAGGQGNISSGFASAVGGGYGNTASGRQSATVSGGTSNTASGESGAIGGGQGNTASGTYATVAGGFVNTASGPDSAVGGGVSNTASAYTAIVGGGDSNVASGVASTIGGGAGNTAGGQDATIGGGNDNEASAERATVGGGDSNTASAIDSTVAGGVDNTAAGLGAAIGGGYSNHAAGNYSAILGGESNSAAGANSIALGTRAETTSAATGSFVFSDASGTGLFGSGKAGEFLVAATGGIGMWTQKDYNTGCKIPAGSGTWTCSSSRELKHDFAAVDAASVLSKVVAMPITTWRYKTEAGALHIGPVAEDFRAAFGLGADDKSITTSDESGIALAAIQGLDRLLLREDADMRRALRQKDAQIKAEQHELVSQRAEIDALKNRMAQMETVAAQVAALRATIAQMSSDRVASVH